MMEVQTGVEKFVMSMLKKTSVYKLFINLMEDFQMQGIRPWI